MANKSILSSDAGKQKLMTSSKREYVDYFATLKSADARNKDYESKSKPNQQFDEHRKATLKYAEEKAKQNESQTKPSLWGNKRY